MNFFFVFLGMVFCFLEVVFCVFCFFNSFLIVDCVLGSVFIGWDKVWIIGGDIVWFVFFEIVWFFVGCDDFVLFLLIKFVLVVLVDVVCCLWCSCLIFFVNDICWGFVGWGDVVGVVGVVGGGIREFVLGVVVGIFLFGGDGDCLVILGVSFELVRIFFINVGEVGVVRFKGLIFLRSLLVWLVVVFFVVVVISFEVGDIGVFGVWFLFLVFCVGFFLNFELLGWDVVGVDFFLDFELIDVVLLVFGRDFFDLLFVNIFLSWMMVSCWIFLLERKLVLNLVNVVF